MSELKPVSSPAAILSSVISNNANALNNFEIKTEEIDEFFDVPLEEFLYHAKLQRELEKSPDYGEAAPTIPLWDVIKTKLLNRPATKKSSAAASDAHSAKSFKSSAEEVSEKDAHGVDDPEDEKLQIVNQQSYDLINEPLYTSKENANRMLRVASWGSVFYLITTDILGPTSAPYAIAQLGYVPGALLYFLFGIAAAYCGCLLWKQYLYLDSIKYPLRNYGDIVGRIYGQYTRYFIDFFQSVQ